MEYTTKIYFPKLLAAKKILFPIWTIATWTPWIFVTSILLAAVIEENCLSGRIKPIGFIHLLHHRGAPYGILYRFWLPIIAT